MALIHTCYRIADIDRSVAFYNALGFVEVGRIPIRDEAVNVFMNQPGDGDMPRLDLAEAVALRDAVPLELAQRAQDGHEGRHRVLAPVEPRCVARGTPGRHRGGRRR